MYLAATLFHHLPPTDMTQAPRFRTLPQVQTRCGCVSLPNDFEDHVPVTQRVGLDVGIGQSSPQLPHRVLAAQIRHFFRLSKHETTHHFLLKSTSKMHENLQRWQRIQLEHTYYKVFIVICVCLPNCHLMVSKLNCFGLA